MAHIAIVVGALSVKESQLHIEGQAFVSSAWTASTAEINVAIQDAAIAAAATAGHTITVLDTKTVFAVAGV